MEELPPGSTYLFTLAAVSITFVGFAALFTALREVVAGKTTAFDVVLTRNHFVLGFMVVAASLLPPLLALFPLPEYVVWWGASIVAAFPPAVFAIRYPKRRFAATKTAMPFGTKVILFFLYLTTVVLLVNLIPTPFSPGPALYALGVTIHLFTNICAFIYALRFVLDASPSSEAAPILGSAEARAGERAAKSAG